MINKKMDGKTRLIIILVGTIIILGSGYAYKEIIENSAEQDLRIGAGNYTIGFQDGQIDFYQRMLIDLSEDGEITIPVQTEDGLINVILEVKTNS